jgi:hypothetical protein
VFEGEGGEEDIVGERRVEVVRRGIYEEMDGWDGAGM